MVSLVKEVPHGLELEYEKFSKMSDVELYKRLKEGFTREDCCYGMIILSIITERALTSMNNKIAALNHENQLLRNHILSMPEGSLYFEAKQHYESLN